MNGSDGVSPELRERVFKCARKLNFNLGGKNKAKVLAFAVLCALAASLATLHWCILLTNQWLTYTGRRRYRWSAPMVAPLLATSGLLIYPAAWSRYVWLYGAADPATLSLWYSMIYGAYAKVAQRGSRQVQSLSSPKGNTPHR